MARTDPFDEAVRVVLQHEGGWANHPSDPGGPTNWGISLRLLRELAAEGDTSGDVDHDGDVDGVDVRQLTRDQAVAYYRGHWWDRHGYDRIAALGAELPWYNAIARRVAAKLLDLAVNMGAHHAHLCLQRALLAAGQTVAQDGRIGPATRAALERADLGAVLAALRSEAASRYRELAAGNPKLRPFLTGWLRRAYS